MFSIDEHDTTDAGCIGVFIAGLQEKVSITRPREIAKMRLFKGGIVHMLKRQQRTGTTVGAALIAASMIGGLGSTPAYGTNAPCGMSIHQQRVGVPVPDRPVTFQFIWGNSCAEQATDVTTQFIVPSEVTIESTN